MPETSATEITVEKTPAYFVSKTAPGRVRSLNSTIKLIVVVRNPITRAISGNFMKFYSNIFISDNAELLTTACKILTKFYIKI